MRVSVMPARGGGATPRGASSVQTMVSASRTCTSLRRCCPFHPPKMYSLWPRMAEQWLARASGLAPSVSTASQLVVWLVGGWWIGFASWGYDKGRATTKQNTLLL